MTASQSSSVREGVAEGHHLDARLEEEWDQRAAIWDDVAQSAAFHGFRDVILDAAGLRPHDAVVDIGCGTGLVALKAAELGASVTGVDASGEMLERLQARARAHGLDGLSLI